jgi:hypothetical protein
MWLARILQRDGKEVNILHVQEDNPFHHVDSISVVQ